MSEGTTRQTKIRELAIAFLEEHLKMQYSSFHGTILDITEEQMALEIKAYLNGGIPWPIISSDVLKKLLIDFGQAAYSAGREDGLEEAIQLCLHPAGHCNRNCHRDDAEAIEEIRSLSSKKDSEVGNGR